MFYLKKISDFKIKKAKGIFLYNYSQNKIKYLSNYESIYTFSPKKTKSHLKNYLSKGWGLPFFNKKTEKENILKLFFFNKQLFKYFGSLKIYEDKKRFEKIYKKSLQTSINNILPGFSNCLPQCLNLNCNQFIHNYDRYNFLKKTKDFINTNRFKTLISDIYNKIYENSFNFNELSSIKNNIIYAQGFPFWLDNLNINKIKLFINKNYKKDHFKSFFINLLFQYFYFSLNFNLKLFENEIDRLHIDYFLDAYLNNDFNHYNMILKKNHEKSFYLEQFFLNYIIVLYIHSEVLKLLKKNNNLIILDETKTGFRFFPFSTYFDFYNIYDSISKGKNIFNNNEYFNIYLFGNNLSSGLKYNILIFCDNAINKVTDSLLNHNLLNNYHDSVYNPFAIEVLKYNYLLLKQTLILKEFYKTLKDLEYSFLYKKRNYLDFFSLIGPYLKIYPSFDSKTDLKKIINRLNNLLPFKTKNLKTLFLNIFKIYSEYNYGILPLNISRQDIDSLRSVYKKYIEILKQLN